MEIKFNIEKSQRKALAQKIAEISGNTVQYLGAPTFSYQIGNFMGFTNWRHTGVAAGLLRQGINHTILPEI